MSTAAGRGRPKKTPPTAEAVKHLAWERGERHSRINDAIRAAGFENKQAFLISFDLSYSTLYRWELRGDSPHGPRSPGSRRIDAAFLGKCLNIDPSYLLPGGPAIFTQTAKTAKADDP